VFFVVATSSIVSWIITATMLPASLASMLRRFSSDPSVFLFLVIVSLLLVGCLLDNIAAMIMIAPILAPIAVQYGVDPLHFGFVFVLSSVIGMLTPPVGIVLFTVSGIAKLPIEKVTVEALPLLSAWLLLVLKDFMISISIQAPPHLCESGIVQISHDGVRPKEWPES